MSQSRAFIRVTWLWQIEKLFSSSKNKKEKKKGQHVSLTHKQYGWTPYQIRTNFISIVQKRFFEVFVPFQYPCHCCWSLSLSLLSVLRIGDNQCFSFLWCTGLAITTMFHIQFELVRTLRRNETLGGFLEICNRKRTSWLFYKGGQEFEIGRTNPASGQGGTWTRGLRITSPAL